MPASEPVLQTMMSCGPSAKEIKDTFYKYDTYFYNFSFIFNRTPSKSFFYHCFLWNFVPQFKEVTSGLLPDTCSPQISALVLALQVKERKAHPCCTNGLSSDTEPSWHVNPACLIPEPRLFLAPTGSSWNISLGDGLHVHTSSATLQDIPHVIVGKTERFARVTGQNT